MSLYLEQLSFTEIQQTEIFTRDYIGIEKWNGMWPVEKRSNFELCNNGNDDGKEYHMQFFIICKNEVLMGYLNIKCWRKRTKDKTIKLFISKSQVY